MAVFDWYGWTGAAAGSLLANYLGAKVKPVISSISNNDLTKYAYIAAQITQVGQRGRPNVAEMVDGASEWAVGDLAGSMLAKSLHISTTAPVAAVAVAATAPAATSTTTSGPVGVPAAGGSSAFDLPIPGY